MSNQTVPITIGHNTVPVGVNPATVDELLTVISQYLTAQISTDVSFFVKGTVDPTQNVGQVFLNTAEGVFKNWDTGSGKYLPITSTYSPGDMKLTFASGDDPQHGWVMCDGRAISAISGITQTQSGVLQQLFGAGGNLPTVQPVQALSGLPAAGSFAGLIPPDVQPPGQQFAGLTFSGTYNPAEEQNLANNAEALRGSTESVKSSLSDVCTNMEAVLAAMIGGGQPLYANVFAGYP